LKGYLYPLNKMLIGEARAIPFYKSFANVVSDSLKKLPSYNGVVYRGLALRLEKKEKFYNKYKEGEVITENAFISTSKNMEKALDFAKPRHQDQDNVLFIINSKTGKHIENISEYGKYNDEDLNEEEILFNKQIKFKINAIKKDKGYVFITMDEI
jgi:hypothetical protein